MIFPSFGDAEGYALLGSACAEAVLGSAPAFEACYHPVRPIGATALMTLPFLATSDPVDAAYAALAVNVGLFAVVVACVAAALMEDGEVLPGRPGRILLVASLTFAAFLPNLVSLIPVRLADIPSLAPFAAALLAGIRTVRGRWSGRPLLRRYAIIGLLCAIAVLLNVRYFVYAFVLLAAVLVFDRSARGARIRCIAAFVAGMAPVALQVAHVYAHTGQVGLYDREYMARTFPPRPTGIEAEFSTIPVRNAYMVHAEGDASYPAIAGLRLYRGLTGFEWAVYHGAAARGPVWAVGTATHVRAWAVIAAYVAFAAWVIRKGPPSLRVLNLTAVPLALATAALAHTELRYYALPRSVLWLTIALTLLAASPRRAAVSRSAPPTP